MKNPMKAFVLGNIILIMVLGLFGAYAVSLSSREHYETTPDTLAYWILSGPDMVNIEAMVGKDRFSGYEYGFHEDSVTEKLIFKAGTPDSALDFAQQQMEKAGYKVERVEDNGTVVLNKDKGYELYIDKTEPKGIRIESK